KPGLPIEGFLLGQRDFPTQPDVERELRGRLPVVLCEEGQHSRAVARLRAVDRLARAVRAPENEAREGMTRRAREAGERGFRAGESEGTRQVARLIGVVTVACELSPELNAVLPERIAVSDLVDVALRSVDVFTPINDHIHILHISSGVHEAHGWTA